MHQKCGHREHHQSFRVCSRNYQGCPCAAISPVTPVVNRGMPNRERLGRSRYACRFRLPHPLQHVAAGAVRPVTEHRRPRGVDDQES
ncbi:hypothetical protein ANMWB30_02890 [Arthrobacter sp. MWB30]|nr:hypothetical protein ANMWB30_02890 [Arthrobacter sp. MWB30]